MMESTEGPCYQNVLMISHKGKGIPYGGCTTPRADGGTNHGFQDLKGQPELLDEIPELRADTALRALIRIINAPTTGIFSVGCLSADTTDEHGRWVTGYVEFAFNSVTATADAGSYFPAFFHFDRFLFARGFAHPVSFVWQILGARFLSSRTDGFTAAVTINTSRFPSIGAARTSWDAACGALTEFLSGIPPAGGQQICPFAELRQSP